MSSSSQHVDPEEETYIPPSGSSSSDSSDDQSTSNLKQLMQLVQDESEEEFDYFHNVIIPQLLQQYNSMQKLANPPKKRRGGSKVGRRYVPRNHTTAFDRLEANYFCDNHTFNERQFCNRFRIPRSIFEKIYVELCQHPLFIQKWDAANKIGIHPKVKAKIALRFLAYGSASDALDETYFLENQTALYALDDFCIAMNEIFGNEYLITPNQADVARILAESENRGWLGCMGSIDCTTWEWKNCPVEWAGQFIGKESFPSIVLEAAYSHDGWIWHSFFGIAGGMNDRTILNLSPVLNPYCSGALPPIEFTINDHSYNMGYYLADGIYPTWTCLVTVEKDPRTPQQIHFTKCQESTRKDIECAFGRLKGKWHILNRPSRFHCMQVMTRIMYTCIILHNMVVQSKSSNNERDYIPDAVPPQKIYASGSDKFTLRYDYARNEAVGTALKAYLIQHLWSRRNA